MNPKYEPAMIALARDHHRNRRLDLALYALKAVLDGENENNPARNKNNAEGHLLRAIIFKEQQKRALAMDEFKRAVELRPDFVDARVQLATYLLESGNPDEALPQLDAALKYQNENVKARLNRADAYRLLGKVAESKAEFEWVAKKDSSMYQTYYGLGLLYLNSQVPGMDEKSRLSAAISSLEKYQQLRPKTASGGSDDSDQLLQRAKAKQDAISANEQAAAQASAQAAAAASESAAAAASGAPSGSAAPATSASAKP
ncbi:MAG: tetratricopeptide repeat protein [Polyangiaceae bacterium]